MKTERPKAVLEKKFPLLPAVSVLILCAIAVFLFSYDAKADDSAESMPTAEPILEQILEEAPSAEEVTAVPTEAVPLSCTKACSEQAKVFWKNVVELKDEYFGDEEETEIVSTDSPEEVTLGNDANEAQEVAAANEDG